MRVGGKSGTGGMRSFVVALALVATAAVPERALAACDDVVADALSRYVRRSFELRKTCTAIVLRGGTCSIQPSQQRERQRFAAAIRAACTAEELMALGPGGCAGEAAGGQGAFIACALTAANTHVQRMLAPIFGLAAPSPTPTGPNVPPTPTLTPRPTSTRGPSPTPAPRCAGLNQPCFGPGISGCCAPFQCRVTGVDNREICALPPPPPPSSSGAFLDGSPPCF